MRRTRRAGIEQVEDKLVVIVILRVEIDRHVVGGTAVLSLTLVNGDLRSCASTAEIDRDFFVTIASLSEIDDKFRRG